MGRQRSDRDIMNQPSSRPRSLSLRAWVLAVITASAWAPPTALADRVAIDPGAVLRGSSSHPMLPGVDEHWPMEPWTQTVDTLDSDAVDGFTIGKEDGTLVAFPGDGTEWVPGVLGRGLEFDGVDRHVTHAYDLPRAAGAISHWLRSDVDDQLRVAFYTSDSPGIGADYNGFGAATLTALEIHTGIFNNEFYAIYQDGVGPTNSPGSGIREVRGGVVTPGRWTHVALSWDLAGDLVLYVDCVPVATVAMADGVFAGHAPTDRFIGKPSQFGGRHWNGAMDDVRVFASPLNAEQVSVFCREKSYLPAAALQAPAPAENGYFGEEVEFDGDWLLVSEANQVHWYARTGTQNFEHAATHPGSLNPGQFSDPFSLDGSTTLIGGTPIAGSSSTVLFHEQDLGGANAWGVSAQRGKDFNDPGSFGAAVSLSGDLAAVGSPDGEDGGSFYIFGRDVGGTNAWGRVRWQESFLDSFGRQIALDGFTLAVAFGGPTSITWGVSIFERDQGGADTWGNVTSIGASGTVFGLDLRGDRLAVGMPSSAVSGGVAAGIVAIHSRDEGGPDNWGMEQLLWPLDGDAVDNFGLKVAWLSDDLLAVGGSADQRDHSVVYLFRRDSTGEWQQIDMIMEGTWPFLAEKEAALGMGIAGDAEIIIAGAPFTGDSLTPPEPAPILRAGRVYIYSFDRISASSFEAAEASD